jgi:hypothetical protein
MSSSSASETVHKIKCLLKKVEEQEQSSNDEKADASSLDELRRIFVQCMTRQELFWCNTDSKGIISTGSTAEEALIANAKQKYNSWLQRQYSIYVEHLCYRLQTGKKYALRCLCGLLFSPLSMQRNNNNNVDSATQANYRNHIQSIWVKAVQALCYRETVLITSPDNITDNHTIIKQDALIQMFLQEFVIPHPDVLYMTFSSIKQVAAQLQRQQQHKKDTKLQQCSIENIISIVEQLPIINNSSELKDDSKFIFSYNRDSEGLLDLKDREEEEEEETSDEGEDNYDDDEDDDDNTKEGENKKEPFNELTKAGKKKQRRKQPEKILSCHKRIVEETWLAILQLGNLIPIKCHKRMVPYISQRIVPYVHHPLRFAEYFTNCYNAHSDSTTTILPCLALHGLFHLITKYEFEHANFYQCLYRLLKPAVFYAKFRTRFLTLLVQTLSSQPKLPAYVVAAFLKRLCRCALSAPPSGALFVLALSSNLLRQHKACACLIHRKPSTTLLQDSFDAVTNDPLQSRGK